MYDVIDCCKKDPVPFRADPDVDLRRLLGTNTVLERVFNKRYKNQWRHKKGIQIAFGRKVHVYLVGKPHLLQLDEIMNKVHFIVQWHLITLCFRKDVPHDGG